MEQTGLICSLYDLKCRRNALLCLRLSFLEVHISTPTYQNAFMLEPWVSCEVGFHSIPSDPGSMPMDGATWSKSSTCSKCGMSVLKFSRSSYLDSHLSESIHAWTKGNL